MRTRRSVKQYDTAIMRRIGELQRARLYTKDEELSKSMKAQIKVLYDVWHEVTHDERVLEPVKPEAYLIEDTYENCYRIYSNIGKTKVSSQGLFSVKEVEEMGFEIKQIKDR